MITYSRFGGRSFSRHDGPRRWTILSSFLVRAHTRFLSACFFFSLSSSSSSLSFEIFSLYSRQNFDWSPSSPFFTNETIWKYSSRLFCSGVPVSSTRRGVATRSSAWYSFESVFLIT